MEFALKLLIQKSSPQQYDFSTKSKNIDSHVRDMTFQIPDGTPS